MSKLVLHETRLNVNMLLDLQLRVEKRVAGVGVEPTAKGL